MLAEDERTILKRRKRVKASACTQTRINNLQVLLHCVVYVYLFTITSDSLLRLLHFNVVHSSSGTLCLSALYMYMFA